jgi:hypothetical protein
MIEQMDCMQPRTRIRKANSSAIGVLRIQNQFSSRQSKLVPRKSECPRSVPESKSLPTQTGVNDGILAQHAKRAWRPLVRISGSESSWKSLGDSEAPRWETRTENESMSSWRCRYQSRHPLWISELVRCRGG